MKSFVNPCVLILNPRHIPKCMDALEDLRSPKTYFTGYTERELQEVFSTFIEEHDEFSHFIAVSDDVIVTQQAYEEIRHFLTREFHYHPPVVTGWCNLDSTSSLVNLTSQSFEYDTSYGSDYHFYEWHEVLRKPRYFKQFFGGMCLTAMTRDMWRRFPFECYYPADDPTHPGYGSDHRLAYRLQQADIPIWAARDAFVFHVKEAWNMTDQAPEKQLHRGPEFQEVRFEPIV